MNKVNLDDKWSEVSFRQLSAYSMTNCVEDKVVLVDDLKQLPWNRTENEGIVATDFVALLFCTNGSMEMRMDGKHYRPGKGDILFCSQGAVLCDVQIPSSCQGKVLCLAWKYGQKLFLRSTCQWDSILQLRHNPLLHPDGNEQELYRAYYRLFAAKLKCYCYANDVDCIFQGLFYDLYRMADRYVMQKSRQKNPQVSLRQEDLFKRFITLLKEKHTHERLCLYYADQLCVTPKYLTMVVKKVSGQSVSQWINTYLMDQIKCRLKTTSLTVSEIANELNFNPSFFGKYVKTHTGVSPQKLRQALMEA